MRRGASGVMWGRWERELEERDRGERERIGGKIGREGVLYKIH